MTQKLPFFKMQNVIQDYAWGSHTSVNTLFGIENPSNQPQAEIWMGAHPNGCSQVDVAGEWVSLATLIKQNPEGMLGADTLTRYGELPYLFKVLAAEKALSIQVHPSKQQAEIGYAKENMSGVALNAANRNYKDPNHKPELVYALTPYQAMNGFRELDEMITLFEQVDILEIKPLISDLKGGRDSAALEVFFSALLSLTGEQKTAAVAALMRYAKANTEQPLFALLVDLEKQYPDDIGLFSPLMLNVLTLQPGEAMFLDACTPHAYIHGTGLEIMANSDNVLRAGLTPKYMDVDELVDCTRFKPMPSHTLLTQPIKEAGIEHYPVPVNDFKISLYQGKHQLSVESAEIVFAVDAPVTLRAGDTSLTLQKGESAFVPANVRQYQLEGEGRCARAYN